MADTAYIFEKLLSGFRFPANEGQRLALQMLAGFINETSDDDYFILTGSAGTGKTSLVQAVTTFLDHTGLAFYLAAPTGRAAQIIARSTSFPARTLHSLLYNVVCDEETLSICFSPKTAFPHKDKRIYIIDESSMISDLDTGSNGIFAGQGSLLKQLVSYIKAANRHNKIIFVGDGNQLPPVGSDFSPALSPEYLRGKYNLRGIMYALHRVERHENDSYILKNAGAIIDSMRSGGQPSLAFAASLNFSNSIKSFLTHLNGSASSDAVMIANANAQVNALNKWARIFRYGHTRATDLLLPGDRLISNQNTAVGDDMLFKGTSLTVMRSWKPEELAGLHFINALISFEDLTGKEVQANAKILLESLTSPDGNIPQEKERQLLHEAFRKNRRFRNSRDRADDAFVNAIRPRYGYAMTCHKAQGGEWNNVYLHDGYRKDNHRWLYTAVTRARKQLFSITGNTK